VHRLFDRGYVTVTPDYRFEVSPRLKQDFDNGKTYYALHGSPIRLPANPQERPETALLQWHNENVFRAAG
jgi:putative restriction endonuclease